MTYTVRGRLSPTEIAEVTWSNGQLRGNPQVIACLREHAHRLEGKSVGPVCGPYTFTRHLADPLSTLTLLRQIFTEILEVRGDRPVLPPVPPGAII